MLGGLPMPEELVDRVVGRGIEALPYEEELRRVGDLGAAGNIMDLERAGRVRNHDRFGAGARPDPAVHEVLRSGGGGGSVGLEDETSTKTCAMYKG